MRSFWRTLDRELVRDIGLVCLADGVVGVSFGAIAISAGQPTWVPLAMSAAVFAGGAQFAALNIVLGGGGLAAAVLAGLVLNARLLPFGFAVADVLDLRRPARLAGSHLVVDESVAFAIAQRDPARRRAAFFACGVLLFVVWNLGTVVGVLAGKAVAHPGALGLDAASPMVLLALVMPALRDPRARRAALLGAAIALAATPFLPGGLPVLLALFGLVAVARPGRGARPGGGARPGCGARPGGGARPGCGARPGGGARPGCGARPGGGAQPGHHSRGDPDVHDSRGDPDFQGGDSKPGKDRDRARDGLASGDDRAGDRDQAGGRDSGGGTGGSGIGDGGQVRPGAAACS